MRLSLLAAFAGVASAATCSISNVYQSHMVLQRDNAATLIHGFAPAGSSVTVSLDGTALSPAIADASGVWRAPLPSTPAGGPHTLSAACGDGSAGGTLSDVLMGDVILCGGQVGVLAPCSLRHGGCGCGCGSGAACARARLPA
jgi:hypothetical protein